MIGWLRRILGREGHRLGVDALARDARRAFGRSDRHRLPPEVSVIADGELRFAAAAEHYGVTETDLLARLRAARLHAIIYGGAALSMAVGGWWWASVPLALLSLRACWWGHQLRHRRLESVWRWLSR